jgi:hypothetical protein
MANDFPAPALAPGRDILYVIFVMHQTAFVLSKEPTICLRQRHQFLRRSSAPWNALAPMSARLGAAVDCLWKWSPIAR